MFQIESNWGRAAVSEISELMIEKDGSPDDAIIAGLFTHTGTDISYGGHIQRTLFDYVLAAYVGRICQKNKIKVIGTKLLDIPIRNCNVYEHTYETQDGKQFYCYQYGTCPSNSYDQLAFSILEREVTQGCKNCNYKGMTDEDIECQICRNGAVRALVSNNPSCKTFRSFGWTIFKDAIGEKPFQITEKFRQHYIELSTDMFNYKSRTMPLMKEYVESDRFGEYFDSDLERDILMLFHDPEEDGEENGNDEGENKAQDD